jgi:hypothetical protein
MKRLLVFAASAGIAVAALAAQAPAPAPVASPFDGTWKIDVGTSELPTKPDAYLLKDGTYHCDSCVPPVVVQADGRDHQVTGHPYYDTKSVRVIDALAIESIDKKGGKVVDQARLTVSADGKTATRVETDSSAPNGPPVTSKVTYTRVLRGAAGSHAISGSWRIVKIDNMSDNGLLVTFKVDGTKLQMNNPLGQSYAAGLDGSDSPFVGDPGVTSVSVKKMGQNTFEETDKRDGKAIWVGRMTVSADGKSMTIMWIDNLHGTSGVYRANKL